MSVVKSGESTRLCIRQTPPCITWRLQKAINRGALWTLENSSTDLDQRVPRAVNDLGGFQIVDTILVGGNANDGSIFLMQIHVDLVALSRVC